MKILYTHNSQKLGGMEQHVLDLVEGVGRQGHEIFVWCPEGRPSENYKKAGAQVTYKQISSDFDSKYINDLASFLKDNEIDIVHSHELKACVNALLASRKAKTPVKITHTHTPISEWKINPLKKKLNAMFYSFMVNKYSDAEIALTESKKKVKIKEGIKEGKLVVIPNGINVEKFAVSHLERRTGEEEIRKKYDIGKNAFVFGNVGRLTREKGLDVLVDAFHKFLSNDYYHTKDFALLIAGGGEMEGEIKRIAANRGISDKVIITGEFPPEDLVKYYSAFDFFVFPTLAEGFGLVLIEALYNELPVICSDLDVLKEVAGDTAVYFKTGDSADLAGKMIEAYEKFVTNDNAPSFRGKQRVANMFSMDAFVNNYISLYERLRKIK
ncbi:MAG: glycosyl transferase [Patescibacteria group bacterium]|nr:MAG: glycosyl transferase [Patescibacteria group bacterium]